MVTTRLSRHARWTTLATAVFCSLVVFSGVTPAVLGGVASIQVGHPGTMGMGVTEAEFFTVQACRQVPGTQGVDGYVIDIGPNTQIKVTAHTRVTDQSGLPLLLNGVFYSPNLPGPPPRCFYMGVEAYQKNPYTFNVPLGARWAVVSLPYGADITITWEFPPF